MANHFSSENHKPKKVYDNFKSASLDCNKHNSKFENVGKKIMVPYICKICNKIHIGRNYRKKITLTVQKDALEKLNKTISNTILIKKIEI